MTVLLPPNQLTLGPYTDADAVTDLPLVTQNGDERRILTFTGEYHSADPEADALLGPTQRPVLTRDWQEATLEDGRCVEVRLAACGLPRCFCAGEYRFVQ